MDIAANSHIRTPRLSLSPLAMHMANDIVAGIGDYQVSRWLAVVPHPYALSDSEAYIQNNNDSAGRNWAIHDAQGLVGTISYTDHLGYWLTRSAWGKGYATEAGRAVIGAVFAASDADSLASSYFLGNAASGKVLEKLGFQNTFVEDDPCLAQGKNLPCQKMILTRRVWMDSMTPICTTRRLIIRKFAPEDWRRLSEFGGRADVAPMMMMLRSPWPKADVVKWMQMAPYRGQIGFRAGIYLPDGLLIGFVGIGGDPVGCAYAIDPAYWGQGYASEAAAGLLDHCFTHLGLTEVQADHFTDNPASGTIMRKLGFEFTHAGQGESLARVEPAPNLNYRLTKKKFDAHDKNH